ncbi:MAG: hypothetical protein IPP87_14710 [Ideonella sp.]|nr:hypothetical protein [Ideonella sp.]
MKPTIVASFSEAGVGEVQWVNDERLVFNLHSTWSGPGLYAVDRDGENFRQLVEATWSFFKAPESGVPLLPGNTYLLHSLGKQDTDEVFVISPQEVSKEKVDYIELRRLNTRTGRSQDVDSPLHSFGWVLDSEGVLRLAVTRLKNVVGVHLRDSNGGWRKITEFEELGKGWMRPSYIGPDGTIYAQAAYGDKAAVFTLDPVTGKLSDKPIALSKDFDVRAGFVANQPEAARPALQHRRADHAMVRCRCPGPAGQARCPAARHRQPPAVAVSRRVTVCAGGVLCRPATLDHPALPP